ncbi:MAG TPA: WD40 repeat domain-containing protein, partial [Gemmataceae bacterium]|nr:WD40 repeat domain-containing protein [Gemmataceae bacterium]
AFSPDGKRLVTASFDKTARVWDVSADDRPATDLVGLGQLLSGHRVDEAGGLIPLTIDELSDLWTRLRAAYPADFTVTPPAARVWRESEIREAMKEGNVAAAEFHYWWLVAEAARGGK